MTAIRAKGAGPLAKISWWVVPPLVIVCELIAVGVLYADWSKPIPTRDQLRGITGSIARREQSCNPGVPPAGLTTCHYKFIFEDGSWFWYPYPNREALDPGDTVTVWVAADEPARPSGWLGQAWAVVKNGRLVASYEGIVKFRLEDQRFFRRLGLAFCLVGVVIAVRDVRRRWQNPAHRLRTPLAWDHLLAGLGLAALIYLAPWDEDWQPLIGWATVGVVVIQGLGSAARREAVEAASLARPPVLTEQPSSQVGIPPQAKDSPSRPSLTAAVAGGSRCAGTWLGKLYSRLDPFVVSTSGVGLTRRLWPSFVVGLRVVRLYLVGLVGCYVLFFLLMLAFGGEWSDWTAQWAFQKQLLVGSVIVVFVFGFGYAMVGRGTGRRWSGGPSATGSRREVVLAVGFVLFCVAGSVYFGISERNWVWIFPGGSGLLFAIDYVLERRGLARRRLEVLMIGTPILFLLPIAYVAITQRSWGLAIFGGLFWLGASVSIVGCLHKRRGSGRTVPGQARHVG